MKRIVSYDPGVSGIGYSIVEYDEQNNDGKIITSGVLVIETNNGTISEFNKGINQSKASERTGYRSTRILYQRSNLRRERLHRVLNTLDILPKHYSESIDFINKLGQFKPNIETKLPHDGNKFLFMDSYNEMCNDFKDTYLGNIQYDWTLYYLRHKALTQKITTNELAWIIMNFNQKRGYYQARGEDDGDDDEDNTRESIVECKIINITKGNNLKNSPTKSFYELELDNGMKLKMCFSQIPDWIDTTKEFIITEKLDNNGIVKKTSISILYTSDEIEQMTISQQHKLYNKIKIRTEKTINDSGLTIGSYIYKTLTTTPSIKIIGKLVRTIDRKFYKDELTQILKKQVEFHKEVFTTEKLRECAKELYRNNIPHYTALCKLDFVHLFVNDIIHYQRPLKSNKSLISDCQLEFNSYLLKSKLVKKPLKCTPTSNPIFQKYRILCTLNNITISDKDGNRYDYDKGILYNYLLSVKEAKESDILKSLKLSPSKYSTNYGKDVMHKCNSTTIEIEDRLHVVTGYIKNQIPNLVYNLWHIIYSVSDKKQYEMALLNFAKKYDLNEREFVDSFKKFKPFKSEYAAYSEKAIKKLLTLMTFGEEWSYDSIDLNTKERIENILTGEDNPDISTEVRTNVIGLESEEMFNGLPEHKAKYIIYNKHSQQDVKDVLHWKTVKDLEDYIRSYNPNLLRNPVVSGVVLDILKIHKELWIQYGDGAIGYFDEIKIELSRELKNSKKEREKIYENNINGERNNRFLSTLLEHLSLDNDVTHKPIIGRHSHLFKLRIFSETLNGSMVKPSHNLVNTENYPEFKQWLNQGYLSPYTGREISINDLFSSNYEREHMIPTSKYIDQSIHNAVICETEVNSLKSDLLAFDFIDKFGGTKVLTNGGNVTILSNDIYTNLIQQTYGNNKLKRENLLRTSLPKKLVSRHLNDTKYISKYISSLLSNLVRNDNDDNGYISKNIIQSNGIITNRLKFDWGINDMWNKLMLPRFEKMNEITQTNDFTKYTTNNVLIPNIPSSLSNVTSVDTKRLDHRHHATDAIIIAFVTHDHISFINNEHSLSLLDDSKKIAIHKNMKNKLCFKVNGNSVFNKPYVNFTEDATQSIETSKIKFKNEIRVLSKTNNKYLKYDQDGKKRYFKQTTPNTSIRKSLHKETVSGLIKTTSINVKSIGDILKNDMLEFIVNKKTKRKIKELIDNGVSRNEIIKLYKANKIEIALNEERMVIRVKISNVFGSKNHDATIETIVDPSCREIIRKHLKSYNDDVSLAFSAIGIEKMNDNIINLNNGIPHNPIYKVRISSNYNASFPVGKSGNKKSKYVFNAKGSNLYMAFYEDAKGNRVNKIIPLENVIERFKCHKTPVPVPENHKLLFHLTPSDLVYLPTTEEYNSKKNFIFDENNKEQLERVFRYVSGSGSICKFKPYRYANVIFDMNHKTQKTNGIKYAVQNEIGLGTQESKNSTGYGEIIAKTCIKLKVGKLGNLSLDK